MPRAAGVDEIAMPPFVDDRRMPDELQIDAEPIRDSPGQVERSVGLLRLDLGEVLPRHPDHGRQLGLRDVEHHARIAAEAGERDPQGRRHAPIQAIVPYLSLTR
jgi:hypothetical protein